MVPDLTLASHGDAARRAGRDRAPVCRLRPHDCLQDAQPVHRHARRARARPAGDPRADRGKSRKPPVPRRRGEADSRRGTPHRPSALRAIAPTLPHRARAAGVERHRRSRPAPSPGDRHRPAAGRAPLSKPRTRSSPSAARGSTRPGATSFMWRSGSSPSSRWEARSRSRSPGPASPGAVNSPPTLASRRASG